MKLNKFRNAGTRTWKTRVLFVDILRRDHETNKEHYFNYKLEDCLYWLSFKDDDSDPRPVLREEFLKLKDITGAKFAKKWLGGIAHLNYLIQRCIWFKNEWNNWKEELFKDLQAEALQKIMELQDGEGSVALSAAKYIANREWEDKTGDNLRGRPTKAEVKGALTEEMRKTKKLQQDYERITNFTVIDGGRATSNKS